MPRRRRPTQPDGRSENRKGNDPARPETYIPRRGPPPGDGRASIRAGPPARCPPRGGFRPLRSARRTLERTRIRCRPWRMAEKRAVQRRVNARDKFQGSCRQRRNAPFRRPRRSLHALHNRMMRGRMERPPAPRDSAFRHSPEHRREARARWRRRPTRPVPRERSREPHRPVARALPAPSWVRLDSLGSRERRAPLGQVRAGRWGRADWALPLQ